MSNYPTFDPPTDSRSLGGALRHRVEGSAFWLPPAAYLHGGFPTDRREGLRDIADCLNARPHARYLGFREPIGKSTLADANEQRDWRLWEDLAKSLIGKARPLYSGEDIGFDIENTVYALDSTTVDFSLTFFPWADFRTTKAGVKIYTQIALRGPIPTCISITGALQHNVLWLDELVFELGVFCVMDRGYMNFNRLDLITRSGAFFVTRAKDSTA